MNTITSDQQPATRLLEFMFTAFATDLQTILDETRIFAVNENQARALSIRVIEAIQNGQDTLVGRTEIEQIGQDTEFPRPINSSEEDYINANYFDLFLIQDYATVQTTRGGTIFALLDCETDAILLARLAMSMVIGNIDGLGTKGEPILNIERVPERSGHSPAFYGAYCIKHELLFSLVRDKCETCGYISCSCPGQQLIMTDKEKL